jgi:hypothetical protein
VAALSAKSQFNTHPTTANADSADHNARAADVALSIGLAVGIGTAVLYFVDNHSNTKSSRLDSSPPTSTVRGFVTPFITNSGGGAGAVLTF